MHKTLVFAVALCVLSPLASSAQSLVGAWTLVETQVVGRGDPYTTTERTGLRVFTETHYARLHTAAFDGPRPRLGENPTDAARLAAIAPFVANGGTYSLDGSTLTEHQMIDKYPDDETITVLNEIRFEGTDTFWVTFQPPRASFTVTQKWVRAEMKPRG